MHDTINIYPLKNAGSRSNTYLKNEHRYLAHCPYSLWQASSTIAASIFSASKEMKNWRFIFERQSDKVSTGRQSYRTKINHQSCRTKRKYQYNVCAQIYFLILLVVTPSTWWHFMHCGPLSEASDGSQLVELYLNSLLETLHTNKVICKRCEQPLYVCWRLIAPGGKKARESVCLKQ